ncbi:replication initiator [Actinokineospora sp. UTMC 2448]|uniref:replication initiator n=1 Tax=Actinokineospora sp. UTMC 2448 TaxID=2268449 RepID=UPI002164018B|nr:replication initiator [Actinokineospora sp. UTMC 2448]UVS78369.1 hypothetical protein Actkin_02102 [Actinokineospora sp. UTMC 2448]
MTALLDDMIADRIRRADYHDWRAKVEATGGCAKPIRLSGEYGLVDTLTERLIHHHSGTVMVPCGNRREAVCPACSDRYAADAFHLMRAGLSGGHKGVPTTVTGHPRAFVTLTPPSFGRVHNQPTTAGGKRRPCACGEFHHDHDPRLGAPLDPDAYDYVGAVLWQAHSGALWNRFTTYLRRRLANLGGLRVGELADHLRLSYGKVAEYQRRGLVHFHAVIRLDGPRGHETPPPAWATADVLDQAVRSAAAAVSVETVRPDGTTLPLAFGAQVNVRTITRDQGDDDQDGIGEDALAGYVAKYATKGTGKSEAADRPIRSQADIDFLRVSDHHRRMIQTCWDLGEHADYATLNLRRWAHMLGFRGHFLTKSRAYSTTFGAIRGDRRAFRLAELLAAADLDPETVVVIGEWDFAGVGHHNDAERELAAAIAESKRAHRQRAYREENRS